MVLQKVMGMHNVLLIIISVDILWIIKILIQLWFAYLIAYKLYIMNFHFTINFHSAICIRVYPYIGLIKIYPSHSLTVVIHLI